MAGDLDALIAYSPPEHFDRSNAMVRLFPEWRTVEQNYFQRTKIFPIMHTMGIRLDVLAAHPTLAEALVSALNKAKQQAMAQLETHQALPVMLPWMSAETGSDECRPPFIV